MNKILTILAVLALSFSANCSIAESAEEISTKSGMITTTKVAYSIDETVVHKLNDDLLSKKTHEKILSASLIKLKAFRKNYLRNVRPAPFPAHAFHRNNFAIW